jgi:hypothetical protein
MMLKAIHASEDRVAAHDKAEAVIKKLEAQKLGQAAKKVKENIDETLIGEFVAYRIAHQEGRAFNDLEET